MGFPNGTVVKKLSAKQEAQIRSLGLEDPLEKEMVTHSGILVWQVPWTEESGRLQYMGSKRVRYDLATKKECPYCPFIPCFPGFFVLISLFIFLFCFFPIVI